MFARCLDVTTGSSPSGSAGPGDIPAASARQSTLGLAAEHLSLIRKKAMTYPAISVLTARQQRPPAYRPGCIFNGATDTFTGPVPGHATGFNIRFQQRRLPAESTRV